MRKFNRPNASADDIPIGREMAITRAELARKWNCSDRDARRLVAELRAVDDGSPYVIVSHSTRPGYYRTDDPDTIEWFVNEQSKRAWNTFAPLKKARRVLKEARGATHG